MKAGTIIKWVSPVSVLVFLMVSNHLMYFGDWQDEGPKILA